MNKNIFERFDSTHREYCHLSSQISNLVGKWVGEHVGFVTDDTPYDGHTGLTRPGEFSWSLIGNNKVSISYAVYEDRWLDYWSDDKYVKVKLNELLKYQDK